MKWKRSRKAREQANASSQSEGQQRLRPGDKTAVTSKSDEGKQVVNTEDREIALDLEDGEEEEDAEEEGEGEDEEESERGFPVRMPQSTDMMQRSTDVGYSPHSSFTDDELEGIPAAGGDRRIGAGL